MTNEQIAEQIKAGGNDNLIPLLWEQVKQFIYYKAESFYKSHSDFCKKRGVELQDLKQVTYFAFLKALQYYKPDKGYKFISFISFPLKSEIRQLLCIHTQSGLNEPLNNCMSLDAPALEPNGDGETDTTFIDLQADENSTEFIEKLDAADISDRIRAELDKLPEKQADIIKLFYLQGESLQNIAKRYTISSESVRQHKVKAERTLRASETLKEIYNSYYKQRISKKNFRHFWTYFDYQPENFEQIRNKHEFEKRILKKTSCNYKRFSSCI